MKIPDENGEDQFYLPTVIAIDVMATRKKLKNQNGREYPNWTDFNQYDASTTFDIFEESYNQALDKIFVGDPENNIPRLFSNEDLNRMGHEGVSICVSGGGAAAVDEVAYTAAVLDSIHHFRDGRIEDMPFEERRTSAPKI